MSECPNCGAAKKETEHVCPKCGLDLRTGRKFILNTNPLGLKIPPGSSIRKDGDDIVIRISNGRGLRPVVIFFWPISLFIIAAAYENMKYVAYAAEGAALLFLILLLAHLLLQKRKTVIRASDDSISTKNPDGSSSMINALEIRQIYCKLEKVDDEAPVRHRGRMLDSPDCTLRPRRTNAFSVIARMKNDEEEKIAGNFKSILLSQFIEEKLEEKYGIMDEPVDEEFEASRKYTAMDQNIPLTTAGSNARINIYLPGVTTKRTHDGFEARQKWSQRQSDTSPFAVITGAAALVCLLHISGLHGLIGVNREIMTVSVAAVAVMAAYLFTANARNTTKIDVTRGSISASCGPVPFPLSFRLKRDDISDVYVDEIINKRGLPLYNVCARTKGHKTFGLLTRLNSLENAQNLVYLVKQTMRIN